MNVLFHIDHLALWSMVAANARNMLAYGEGESLIFQIEIVANGDAVRQLRCDLEPADELAGQLRQLSERGVRIVACANSLSNNGIHEEALLSFVDIVPSGVVEIAMRQHNGFAYIKP